MNRKIMFKALVVAGGVMFATLGSAQAATGIKITEWMYNSNSTSGIGEFVELTNFGPTAVDMTGWSFDDNSRAPGSQSLSSFGSVASGESIILTDMTASDFRTAWGLSSSVKVIGGNLNNLGRSDEINIYDGSNALVDELTYNDQGSGSVKGPRTSGVSAVPNGLSVVGTNSASQWKLSAVGDADNSHASIAIGAISYTGGDIGSPGTVAAVPEPESYALILGGLGLLGFIARRRKQV